ncbi:MAG: DUF5916 domain-containing protein [bacterium]
MISQSTLTRLFLFTLVVVFAVSGLSQPTSDDSKDSDTVSGKTTVVAVHIDTPPELDGEILNDPAYQNAVSAMGFWQTSPDEGQPASEITEVRILYTDQTLYVGVVCYDREPERIIVSDSRRDASLEETDSFQLVLDTYHDKQNGFLFGTNPAGIEYDAQITNEGRGRFGGGRQQRGVIGGFNINWDGSWGVKTKISDIGWSAEFAIPFRTLRFSKKESQTWGVNFQRNIRRRNENAYWVKLPRQYNIQRISLAGTLTGLKNIRQNNLKLVPYTLANANRDFANLQDTEFDGDLGFDVKYSVTPSLTLDATYNTDFAQVEVDEQQINFDRFNLFFPEKRAFFLENAGFFSVGSPGEIDLFFSRRIGISKGFEVPILAGGRLSGKAAGLNIGLLNMQTESREFVDPASLDSIRIQANNFTIARINKELPNRSAIGALFINRQGAGNLAPDDDYNRTFAIDGRWGIGRFGQVLGFAARTVTPGEKEDEYAFRFGAQYNSEAWLLMANYTEVSDAFNPEVGFLQRSGFRKPDFLIFHRYRPENFLGLQELRPHVSYRGFWSFDGFQETGFLHIDNHWEWKNGYEIHTGINFTKEGILPIQTEDDTVKIQNTFIPPGTYNHTEAQIVAFTNQGSWWGYRFRGTIGGFFGGNRVSLSHTVRFRIGEALNTELTYRYNDADLPEGTFTTNQVSARISYSFTPRIFVQGLIQYNDSNDIWSTNLRFGWLQTANTGLFLVYNDIREVHTRSIETQSRSFIVKYNRLFDLLN